LAMSGRDGRWLVGQVETSTRPVPVIAVTGYSEDYDLSGAPLRASSRSPWIPRHWPPRFSKFWAGRAPDFTSQHPNPPDVRIGRGCRRRLPLALICAERTRQARRFQSSSAPKVPLGPEGAEREREAQRSYAQARRKTESRLIAGSRLLESRGRLTNNPAASDDRVFGRCMF
jgi:hypothetical protein